MDPLATEQKAAKILLKRGVKVPVTAPLFLRVFGKKVIVLEVKAPTTNMLLKIADKFLDMGLDQYDDVSLIDGVKLLKTHGRKVAEIIALCILNDPAKVWRHKWLAGFLNKKLRPDELLMLFQLILVQGGVQDFINTIRLIMETRITKPMNLSPKEKTS